MIGNAATHVTRHHCCCRHFHRRLRLLKPACRFSFRTLPQLAHPFGFPLQETEEARQLADRLAWVHQMRAAFSPEGMCLRNGEIDQVCRNTALFVGW